MNRVLPTLLLLHSCVWVTSEDHAARLALLDEDGDGFLDARAGYDDCDDSDPAVNPQATETCARGDEDCDGLEGEDDPDLVPDAYVFTDQDGDGYGDPGSAVPTCSPAPTSITEGGDCDDQDRLINPSADETCAPGDEDCDGRVDDADDSVIDALTLYRDRDGDGFGAGEPVLSCTPRDGYATGADDCDDEDAFAFPGAPEGCPGAGAYRDCDGGEPLCVLDASELEVALSGRPVDDLVAGYDVVAVRVENEVAAWRLRDASPPWRWPSSPVKTDAPDTARIRMAAADGGVIVGSPEEDSDKGMVRWLHEPPDWSEEQLKTTRSNERVGASVAWCPRAAGGGSICTLQVRGSTNHLGTARTDDDRFASGIELAATVTSIDATGVGGGLGLGAFEPLGEDGDGRISVYFGSDPGALFQDARVRASGTRITEPYRVADLGGSSSVTDVAATAGSSVVVWLDPEDEVSEVTWSFELAGRVTAMAIGDLDGDGKTDLAVAAVGASEVRVFMGGSGVETGEPRLAVQGTIGEGLGSALALADVDRDGIDDLLIAGRRGEIVRVLPGSVDW